MPLLLGVGSSAALTSPASRWFPQSHACGGHERWKIKVLIDDDADAVNFTPKVRAINTLRQLDRPPGFLGSKPRQQPVEFTTYQIQQVHLVEAKTEPDDDIHLVVRDKLDRTMIVEFPLPTCTDTATSERIVR